jgi:hypothetical protein
MPSAPLVCRLGAFENLGCIDARSTISIGETRSVAHQATGHDEFRYSYKCTERHGAYDCRCRPSSMRAKWRRDPWLSPKSAGKEDPRCGVTTEETARDNVVDRLCGSV